jgi:hypothetical protein
MSLASISRAQNSYDDLAVGSFFLRKTTNSVSTSTGALTVAGGVGIGGNVTVGGIITGGGIPAPFNPANILALTNTTNSTSSSTGALTVAGGAGISGNLFVNSSLEISTGSYNDNKIVLWQQSPPSLDRNQTCTIGFTNSALGVHLQNAGSHFSILSGTGAATEVENFRIEGSYALGATIFNTANSLSTSTGSLVLNGGLGIAKDTRMGGGLYLPTVGSIPTPLNYYEETLPFSYIISGALESPTVYLQGFYACLNRTLFIHFKQINSPCVAYSPIYTGIVVPPRFFSLDNMYTSIMTFNASTWMRGTICINNLGMIEIWVGDDNNFSNSGNCGITKQVVVFPLP